MFRQVWEHEALAAEIKIGDVDWKVCVDLLILANIFDESMEDGTASFQEGMNRNKRFFVLLGRND
jgi:hypothetical protein